MYKLVENRCKLTCGAASCVTALSIAKIQCGIATMRATPVLSAVALASCRGGGVTAVTTTASAAAAAATATVQPLLSSSAGSIAIRKRGAGGGGRGGGRSRSRGGNSSRTGLLFQYLSTSIPSPSFSSSFFSSFAIRGPARIPRRSVHSVNAGRNASGGGRGGKRLRAHDQDHHPAAAAAAAATPHHHQLQQLPSSFSTAADAAALRARTTRRRKSHRPSTMMMMASSPVTDKDIMREFVTVAASEAASSIKNKPPSAVLDGDSKHNGVPGASATPGGTGKGAGEGDVDDARPTGYRYYHRG